MELFSNLSEVVEVTTDIRDQSKVNYNAIVIVFGNTCNSRFFGETLVAIMLPPVEDRESVSFYKNI